LGEINLYPVFQPYLYLNQAHTKTVGL